MKNNIQTFSMFVRPDAKSQQIAEHIRKLNSLSEKPLKETENGDLIIAIGGDGTFIDAVTKTNFSKEKVYAGIHTGTLGFLQNLSANELYALIKYLSYERELQTRKVFVPEIRVTFDDESTRKFNSLNEILICGKNYSKISFAEYINDALLQNVTGNGIIIANSTGDTAYSMNAGGAIDFSEHFQLVCTLETPIQNASYERFLTNSIICPKVTIVPSTYRETLQIIIDGVPKEIEAEKISSITVSINDSNYIHKFELDSYSKVSTVRNKILGYNI